MIAVLTKIVFSKVSVLLLLDMLLFQFQNLSVAKSLTHKYGARDHDFGLKTVHGGWSVWSSWGACEGICGGIGKRSRRRQCNNPHPANGGLDCIGQDTEFMECELPGCTMAQFKELVQNDPIKMEQFNYLDAVHCTYPSLVERCVKAMCHFETVQSILPNDCNLYWNALHCIKHGFGCPILGGWDKWSEWSECSAQIGEGVQFSLRSCSNPIPSSDSYDCVGDPIRYRSCILSSSFPTGEWSSWSPWSECSNSCGFGVRQRVRLCLNGNLGMVTDGSVNFESLVKTLYIAAQNITMPMPNSLTPICSGPFKEFQLCKAQDCPVDGRWSDWGFWSVCSAECGVGTQFRSRTCSEPPPKYGGANCSGKATEVRKCFLRPCPVSLVEKAVFYGNTSICYPASSNNSRLMVLFVSFNPFSSNGTILRRYVEECHFSCSMVVLYLKNGYLDFVAKHGSCKAIATWPSRLEVDSWFKVLATATSNRITLNLNDLGTISSSFSCQVSSLNHDMSMIVGEHFKGLMKNLFLNFKPVHLKYNSTEAYLPGFSPFNSSNLLFDNMEGEDLRLSLSHVIHASCPPNPDNWRIIFAAKPVKPSGLLFLMPGEDPQNFIAVAIDSRNFVFCLKYDSFYEERKVTFGDFSNGWLYIKLDKSEDKGFRFSVNGGRIQMINPFVHSNPMIRISTSFRCHGDMFFGNIPKTLKQKLEGHENHIPYESADGWLSFLKINNENVDLSNLVSVDPNRASFCSNTITYSDSYKYVPVSPSKTVSLTCMYNPGTKASSLSALWLRMESIIDPHQDNSDVSYRVIDNGSVSELIIESEGSEGQIDGFYSCWVQPVETASKGKLLVSYGVDVSKPLRARAFSTFNSWIKTDVKRTPTEYLVYFLLLLLLFFLLFIVCFCRGCKVERRRVHSTSKRGRPMKDMTSRPKVEYLKLPTYNPNARFSSKEGRDSGSESEPKFNEEKCVEDILVIKDRSPSKDIHAEVDTSLKRRLTSGTQGTIDSIRDDPPSPDHRRLGTKVRRDPILYQKKLVQAVNKLSEEIDDYRKTATLQWQSHTCRSGNSSTNEELINTIDYRTLNSSTETHKNYARREFKDLNSSTETQKKNYARREFKDLNSSTETQKNYTRREFKDLNSSTGTQKTHTRREFKDLNSSTEAQENYRRQFKDLNSSTEAQENYRRQFRDLNSSTETQENYSRRQFKDLNGSTETHKNYSRGEFKDLNSLTETHKNHSGGEFKDLIGHGKEVTHLSQTPFSSKSEKLKNDTREGDEIDIFTLLPTRRKVHKDY